MGSWLLARAGADDVLGIDLSHDALAQAMEIGGNDVRVQHGDVTALALEDASVDVAVSFETIEHVAEPRRALDELARVLADDGLLLVSTPPAERSYDSNPHHLHELTRAELETHLRRLFANVRIVEQSTWYASAVLDASPDGSVTTPLPATVHAEQQAPSDEGAYLLALASNGPLPHPVEGRVVLGNLGAPEGAMRVIGDLGRALEEVNGRQRALERENALLHRRLRESGERHAASLGELADELEAARRAVVAMQDSSSWRLTRPLRAAKRVLRRP